jgi:hypothetical protein
VWNQLLLSSIAYLPNIQNCIAQVSVDKTIHSMLGVS